MVRATIEVQDFDSKQAFPLAPVKFDPELPTDYKLSSSPLEVNLAHHSTARRFRMWTLDAKVEQQDLFGGDARMPDRFRHSPELIDGSQKSQLVDHIRHGRAVRGPAGGGLPADARDRTRLALPSGCHKDKVVFDDIRLDAPP